MITLLYLNSFHALNSLVIPVASIMFRFCCWMFLFQDSGKELSYIAPVGLGLWLLALVFQQDYRIPVNSAFTGNDRDCRIFDY